jgi:hypothetical protein
MSFPTQEEQKSLKLKLTSMLFKDSFIGNSDEKGKQGFHWDIIKGDCSDEYKCFNVDIKLQSSKLPTLVEYIDDLPTKNSIDFSPTGELITIRTKLVSIHLYANQTLGVICKYDNNNETYRIVFDRFGEFERLKINNITLDSNLEINSNLNALEIMNLTKNGTLDELFKYLETPPVLPTDPFEGYPEHRELYEKFKNIGFITKLMMDLK